MANENPVRTCIGCKKTDDHPRHVMVEGVEQIQVTWHMDCHAIATDCPICAGVVAGAKEATGEKLRTYLMKGGS